ncbi:hypothetical protein ACM26V_17190 [Salipaludibacillus sp. HK11]|uniref:hypothetical protein n=1 Tax=Salipaludibacillus sp. HK11 TaxID=3394320 RepID=UPI0039FD427C
MMSVIQLLMKTLPFLFFRIMVYGLFMLVSFIFLGIILAGSIFLFNMFEFAAGFFILIIVVSFFSVLAVLRFLERYVLYMVKVGHISVLTELIRNGEVPDGKAQLSYGKDQVVNHFGSANVCFVVDKLVYRAVRQIQRWLFRIGNYFSFVPGAKNIMAIVSRVMNISLRYIDEAVLSYIMIRKKEGAEETVWKSACDGVVLYAQGWKKVLVTAAGLVVFIYVLNITVFLASVFPLMALGSAVASNAEAASFLGFIAVVGAYVITTAVKRALIDPVCTVAMIRSYQLNIQNLEPSVDLHAKLLKVSSKFKEMFQKSKEKESTSKAEIPETPPSTT